MTTGRSNANGRRHLIVVGGGITGLAAAWEASADPSLDVTVIEAASDTGGKIRTSGIETPEFTQIDEGPDNFLARVPHAVTLCEELGLDDRLVEPAASRAGVWIDDSVIYMPGGTVLGVPYDFDTVESSGILSPEGMARARQETDRDWPAPTVDVSIGAFLSERYGDEVVDRLVSPLVGGINAGNIHELSLRAVTPQLWGAARSGGSLSTTLRRAAEKTVVAQPPRPSRPTEAAPRSGVFRGLVGGTATLTSTLHDHLTGRGVTVMTGTTVTAISRAGHGWQLDTTTGTLNTAVPGAGAMTADAVVMAIPVDHAAPLVADLSPDAAQAMSTIRSASVAMTTLVYPGGSFPRIDRSVSGILVPRGAGLATTAISFGSNKWPHWSGSRADDASAEMSVTSEAAPPVVLRVSTGHVDDPASATLPGDELIERLTREISMLTGSSAVPGATRITRWKDAFPQYEPGHLDLVDDIMAELGEVASTIRLAGASYRGLGIPACIESGRRAAKELLG